jgi:hypothetical protein
MTDLNPSVADPECLSRIRIFPSRIPAQKDSGSRSRIRIIKLKYFNPKLFLSSRKYDQGYSSRIPDPDFDFFTHPGPGVKKGTGSESATLVNPKITYY